MPLYILNQDGKAGMTRRQCTVICTYFPSLISVLVNVINEEETVELRHELMEGRAELPRVRTVLPARGVHPPYIVVNAYDDEIESATAYLRDLA